MRFSTTLLSTVLFVSFGALPIAYGQSAELRGTVTDAQERPVPSVNVVLEQEGGAQVAGTSTNANGTFRFENVSTGSYRLIASAIGYTETTRTVTLDAGA